MQIVTITYHCLVYCGLATATLVLVVRNPRAMLHSYPKEIQAAVPPKTLEEKKQTVMYASAILATIFLYPLFTAWYICSMQPMAFTDIFLFMLALTFSFNLFDLLILDWLMFCTITPKFVVLKGSEGNKGYKNYWFHFIGFLKGLVVMSVISLALAAVVY